MHVDSPHFFITTSYSPSGRASFAVVSDTTKLMPLPLHLAHAMGLTARPTALFQCWPVVGQMPSLVFHLTRHPPHPHSTSTGQTENMARMNLLELLHPLKSNTKNNPSALAPQPQHRRLVVAPASEHNPRPAVDLPSRQRRSSVALRRLR